MKIQKKHIVVGVLGLISVFAAAAYIQYKTLMDYVISFKAVRLRKIAPEYIDFDLYLNYQNKSDVTFRIESQVYDVYLNNEFVAKVVNNSAVPILKKSMNIIPLKITFNPKEVFKKLIKNPVDLIANWDKVNLKVVIKLKIKFWGIHINVPYTYESTIKDLMSAKKEG